jgi:hypothetical protein
MCDGITNGCYMPQVTPIILTTGTILYQGDGAGISNLNASNLASGTLPLARLPTSGVTAGRYGDASNVSQVTVDTYGRVTLGANVSIPGVSTYDGIYSNLVQVPSIALSGNIYGTYAQGYTVVTGRATSYAVTPTDYYIGVNGTGITVTLPLGSTLLTGKTYVVKDESGLAGTFVGYRVTMAASFPDLIDGQDSVILALNYGAVNFIWTGSFWSIY